MCWTSKQSLKRILMRSEETKTALSNFNRGSLHGMKRRKRSFSTIIGLPEWFP